MQPSTATFTIVREFNAPQALVFHAFSDAAALNEWWGPAETKNTVIALDFRPGGIFHFQMDYQGQISYGRFLFVTIEPDELLEFTNAFADEHANVISAPFDANFPKEVFYRLAFTENNGKTTITLTGRPVQPNPEEEPSFRALHDSMQQGFGATFNKLAEYLSSKSDL